MSRKRIIRLYCHSKKISQRTLNLMMIDDFFSSFIEDGAHIQLVYNKSEVSRDLIIERKKKKIFIS